jgi:uncharacterized BrkB/YihY/UPF0761 family membrane protein
MDQLLRPLAAIDRWQQRHIVPGFAVAVVRRFTENRAGHLAALLAYYAFFSVFPLLLVLVTVLGFVLDGRPDLRDDLLSTALGQVPVVSSQLTESEGITGSGLGLLIGLGGALWGGQRVVAAVQHGLNEIYDVPQYERPNPLTQRLRSFATLLVLAGGIVAASTVGSLASVFPDLSGTTEVLLIIATIGLNIATVLVLMQLLTSPDVGVSIPPPFKVVDASRIDGCTYQVGLEDKDGFYFSLSQDLVKFAAMGVNTNDILIYGEQ